MQSFLPFLVAKQLRNNGNKLRQAPNSQWFHLGSIIPREVETNKKKSKLRPEFLNTSTVQARKQWTSYQ